MLREYAIRVFLRSVLRMEEVNSSETSILTEALRLHKPEDGPLRTHRTENFKFYTGNRFSFQNVKFSSF
jgi:hypothetical protein